MPNYWGWHKLNGSDALLPFLANTSATRMGAGNQHRAYLIGGDILNLDDPDVEAELPPDADYGYWPFIERYNLYTATWDSRIPLPSSLMLAPGEEFVDKGAYSPSGEYAPGDIVHEGGVAYYPTLNISGALPSEHIGSYFVTDPADAPSWANDFGMAVAYNNKIYFGSGQAQFGDADAWFMFDAATEEFTRLQNLPFSAGVASYVRRNNLVWLFDDTSYWTYDLDDSEAVWVNIPYSNPTDGGVQVYQLSPVYTSNGRIYAFGSYYVGVDLVYRLFMFDFGWNTWKFASPLMDSPLIGALSWAGYHPETFVPVNFVYGTSEEGEQQLWIFQQDAPEWVPANGYVWEQITIQVPPDNAPIADQYNMPAFVGYEFEEPDIYAGAKALVDGNPEFVKGVWRYGLVSGPPPPPLEGLPAIGGTIIAIGGNLLIISEAAGGGGPSAPAPFADVYEDGQRWLSWAVDFDGREFAPVLPDTDPGLPAGTNYIDYVLQPEGAQGEDGYGLLETFAYVWAWNIANPGDQKWTMDPPGTYPVAAGTYSLMAYMPGVEADIMAWEPFVPTLPPGMTFSGGA